MKIPRATYRLQFHAGFTFEHARKITDYLARLGVSDIYASPIFKARKDSVHGYDVTDPTQINPQLGGKEGFDALVAKAQEKGLGWLQDIVPNHMAFDSDNRLLIDILENGPRSRYYSFFDIQWDHPYQHLKGKLLAPFLDELYGKCLDNGEIKLGFDEDGFNVRYHDWRFPIKIGSYSKVLSANLSWLDGKIQREDKDYIQFLESGNQFKALSESGDAGDYYNQLALLKARLWKMYLSNEVIKGYMDALITATNGTAGDSQSFNRLDELLSEQYFKLSFWKVGNEELNYRRFFTINGLLSARVENQDVFEHTHNFIFQLIKAGQVNGVRVDHIDGLYDPVAYLNKLRQRDTELYITVEKILDLDEELPSSMPVQGTTGYDFMNVVNQVFVDQDNARAMDRFYVSFTGQTTAYRDLVAAKKKMFMGQHMAGDIDNLALLLKQIINGDRYGGDMTMYALRRAIVEIMAQFPVYRAYMGAPELTEGDKLHIKEAIARAENRNPGLANELNFIARILLLEFAPDLNPKKKEDYYHFTKKFQQFSGALMAKGAEDTSFYIYNRFISLNEVGGDPSIFGLPLKHFHDFMTDRQKLWPMTLNATSTHDTKRGEDVRARLNVLSEMPKQWQQQVTFWNRVNRKKKTMVNGLKAPDRNDEYFIYQTLIGTYPYDGEDKAQFMERMAQYIVKALREAEVHTTWIRQDAEYEGACVNFIRGILADDAPNPFLDSFIPFQKRIAAEGALNSMAQTVLKMTCPGIPDFYQGAELWDLNLVDPDNRRPVDYAARMGLLDALKDKDGRQAFSDFQEHHDPAIKLFVITKLLQARRQQAELFLKGEYIPLEIEGEANKYAIAFIRRLGPVWALTVVPRFTRRFHEEQRQWKDIFLKLPAQAPGQWKDIFTGIDLTATEKIPMEGMFKDFPVVFLMAGV